MREGDCVFQRVWAAFTLRWAVVRVKGGRWWDMCVCVFCWWVVVGCR